ncbi:unnamed protein product [Cylicocyclus nassatus]|uniref:Fibronectin type-III domain-containing protein n=1 Tax=Cylicocyclus nassatus TaxID=53992 RepID=A0AA36M8S4_CYLNA|nr:unnamed protein product [Cylicocyclus nassatus]
MAQNTAILAICFIMLMIEDAGGTKPAKPVLVILPEESFTKLKCEGQVVWKFENEIIRDYRWDLIINGSIIYIYVHYPTVGYYTCEHANKIIKRFGVFTKQYSIGASKDELMFYPHKESCLPRNMSIAHLWNSREHSTSQLEVKYTYYGPEMAYCRFYSYKLNMEKKIELLPFGTQFYHATKQQFLFYPMLKHSQWVSFECICKNDTTLGTTGKIFHYLDFQEDVKISPNAYFVSNVLSRSFVLYFELPREAVIKQEQLIGYQITVYREDILKSTKVSDIYIDFREIRMIYEEFAVHVITNLQPETAYAVSARFGNIFGYVGPYGKFVRVRTTKYDVNPMDITRVSLSKMEPNKVRLKWEGKVTSVNVQLFRTQKDIRYLKDVKDNDIELDSLQESTFYNLTVEAHKSSTISTPIVIHFMTPRKAERSKAKAKAAAVVEELQKSVEEGERRIAEKMESLEQVRQELPKKRAALNKRAREVEKKRTLMISRQGFLFKAFFKWKTILLAICALQFAIIAGMLTFTLLQYFALYKMKRR